jgi:DNA-binding beta-propeller fold protein YncE
VTKLRLFIILAICALSFTCAWQRIGAHENPPIDSSMSLQEGQPRVRAPELAGGTGWLNTDRPLSLAGLRGKVVLLDFWTYGCINCIHIIPDLKRLEAKYPNELVVIGVHSAKFDNERETENIRQIILRYEIEHPVVNDAEFAIWQSYAVRAWPTQVLIDPAGYIVGTVTGEGNYETIDRAIERTITEFRRRGELNEQPLQLALERARVGSMPLQFPGKVLADERSNRLFIADSNHNRIVVTRLDGTLLEIIGTGASGMMDGAFDRATFNRPQGMAIDGDNLYVADTGNHSIRRIDLRTRTVSAVAGTGQQSRVYGSDTRGAARSTPLSSPWDLLLVGRTLYIAMAGPHQIWKLDLQTNEVSVFAGSGREARTDGRLTEAAFAQPSGLASDGRALFIADSESNIIRRIDLTSGEVTTLAGGDLFEFGDRDGRGDVVRLQHPLGVVFHNGSVFVADTYNHKIKQLNPQTGSVETFAGAGRAGQADGARPSFYEPGGLSVANNRLYIADTNNHAVRVVDLRTRAVETLRIAGLRPPMTSVNNSMTGETESPGVNAEEISVATQRIGATGDGAITVNVRLPSGYHLNETAPQRYRVTIEGSEGNTALTFPVPTRTAQNLQLPVRIPFRASAQGTSTARVQLTLFYCREDNTGTCHIKTLRWRVPVEITSGANAAREIRLEAVIPTP